jgi:hypothetical protein
VYQYFKDRPHDFEQFTADLWRMSQPNVDRIDVTRPWRDGGRDAVGDYLLGPRSDPSRSSSRWKPSVTPQRMESASARQTGSSHGYGTANSAYWSLPLILTPGLTGRSARTGTR